MCAYTHTVLQVHLSRNTASEQQTKRLFPEMQAHAVLTSTAHARVSPVMSSVSVCARASLSLRSLAVSKQGEMTSNPAKVYTSTGHPSSACPQIVYYRENHL
jgi:hypothetical protein